MPSCYKLLAYNDEVSANMNKKYQHVKSKNNHILGIKYDKVFHYKHKASALHGWCLYKAD